MSDHYETLQVHPKADGDAIQSAYERLRERYNPAKFDGAAEELIELARNKRDEIERAYAVLSDPQRRAAYDDELRAAQATTQPGSTRIYREDELIDYRPLPPAGRQERPPNFNAQPYLAPHQVEQKRNKPDDGKPPPFFGRPAAIAAILTFVVVLTTLLMTAGGSTQLMHARMMGENQGQAQAQNQDMPAPEQLTQPFEGQIVQARETAQQFPDNPNAWVSLGNVLYDSVQIVHEHVPESDTYRELLPRWLEATEAYSKALALDPDNAVARSDMGVSLCNYGVGVNDQDYVQRGLQEAQKAVASDPEKERVLLNVGTCLVSIQPPQTQEALKHWRKILLLPEADQMVASQAQVLIKKYTANGSGINED